MTATSFRAHGVQVGVRLDKTGSEALERLIASLSEQLGTPVTISQAVRHAIVKMAPLADETQQAA